MDKNIVKKKSFSEKIGKLHFLIGELLIITALLNK